MYRGAVMGAAIGGVGFAINYLVNYAGMKDEFKYYNGESTGAGEKLEYSNKTLQQMRRTYQSSGTWQNSPTSAREYGVGSDQIPMLKIPTGFL